MKFLAVFLALVVVVLADHEHGHGAHEHVHGAHEHVHGGHDYVVKTHEDLVKFREHCVEKLHVPAELVEKYKVWQYPDDAVTHCYMKCIMEEFGLFDEKTGFDVHNVHHQLVGGSHTDVNHHDATHETIEKCADKNTEGSDACTWAYRGSTCFIRENLRLVQQSVKKD